MHSRSIFNDGIIRLRGAGNEVVAFQTILQATRHEKNIRVELSGLTGPKRLRPGHEIQAFLAHYIQAVDADYSWGPGTKGVLP